MDNSIICQADISIVPLPPGIWEYPAGMEREETILQARIRERLAATGKSARALSLEIGANGGYVRDLLDPDRSPSPSAPRLQAMAAALQTTTEYLLGSSENPEQVLSEVAIGDNRLEYLAQTPSSRRPAEDQTPGIPLVGTGDCADLEVIDDDGHDITIERSSFDADYQVRMIDRPPALRGARHAYAIYFQGSSMEPRFFAGEIGIVDPDRPAAPGDFVLVQLNNGEEDHVVSVLVKRLIRQTSAYLELEQFNPATIFKIDKGKVARVHKIMPPTDLLFR